MNICKMEDVNLFSMSYGSYKDQIKFCMYNSFF